MKSALILLLAFLALFYGCIEQAQQLIAPQAQAAENATVPQYFTCASGANVTDLFACTCIPDCSDNNPCTRDACDPQANQCSHLPIDGSAAGCFGDAGSCRSYTCVRGVCDTVPSGSCCGDGKRSPGETCSSCPTDVNCSQGELCCAQGCMAAACSSDSGCDDSVLGTKDACENPGSCAAKCTNAQIRECTNGDSACPFGCSISTDSDCKVQTTGTTTSITEEFIVSFSNPHLQSCKMAERQFFDNFIIYEVTFENLAPESYPVFVQDFYARSATYGIDQDNADDAYTVYTNDNYAASGEQHPTRRYAFLAQPPLLAPPSDYEPPCNATERFSNLFQNANVQQGDIVQGRVWVKIGSNGGYEKGIWSLGYAPKLDASNTIEAQIYIN